MIQLLKSYLSTVDFGIIHIFISSHNSCTKLIPDKFETNEHDGYICLVIIIHRKIILKI